MFFEVGCDPVSLFLSSLFALKLAFCHFICSFDIGLSGLDFVIRCGWSRRGGIILFRLFVLSPAAVDTRSSASPPFIKVLIMMRAFQGLRLVKHATTHDKRTWCWWTSPSALKKKGRGIKTLYTLIVAQWAGALKLNLQNSCFCFDDLNERPLRINSNLYLPLEVFIVLVVILIKLM